MTFKYRCSRCRVRHTFKRQLDDYMRPKRCKACGHSRFYWDKERNGRREICGCDGYHFTHRKGSRMCHHNPLHELHERLRQGENESEVRLDLTLAGTIIGYTGEQPPF